MATTDVVALYAACFAIGATPGLIKLLYQWYTRPKVETLTAEQALERLRSQFGVPPTTSMRAIDIMNVQLVEWGLYDWEVYPQYTPEHKGYVLMMRRISTYTKGAE